MGKIGLILVLLVFGGWAVAQQAREEWTPPPKLRSPSGKYSIQIVDERAPNAPQYEEQTLMIRAGKKVVARFPTFGFLLSAYWSPGEHFVAINNRRANAGDYLWIVSLPTGTALHMPENVADSMGKKELGEVRGESDTEFFKRFPNCEGEGVRHAWLMAKSWKSANELNVFEEWTCWKLDGYAEINRVYRVEANGVSLESESISQQKESVWD